MDLKTGDLVLCKVGSFPPWPAVVFPQRYLRKDVYRKRKKNCVAVCFFNDPTYYWEQPSRLKELSTNIIDNFLRNNSNSDGELYNAYKEAKSYSDLKLFMTKRFNTEKRANDLKRLKDERNLEGEDPFEGLVAANKSPIVETPSFKNKVSKEESKTPTKETITTQKKKFTLDVKKKIEICMLLRRKIQKNLIQRDKPPTQAEIKETHKLLETIEANLEHAEFFDIDALRKSKLHKLFKVIVNNENLTEFHPICKEILISWNEMVLKLKQEKLEKVA